MRGFKHIIFNDQRFGCHTCQARYLKTRPRNTYCILQCSSYKRADSLLHQTLFYPTLNQEIQILHLCKISSGKLSYLNFIAYA